MGWRGWKSWTSWTSRTLPPPLCLLTLLLLLYHPVAVSGKGISGRGGGWVGANHRRVSEVVDIVGTADTATACCFYATFTFTTTTSSSSPPPPVR